jgi:hypothetical protein
VSWFWLTYIQTIKALIVENEMDRFTTKQREHLASLIRDEVAFFNGWAVSVDSMDSACFKAACKVENYLVRKARREDPNRRVSAAPAKV